MRGGTLATKCRVPKLRSFEDGVGADHIRAHTHTPGLDGDDSGELHFGRLCHAIRAEALAGTERILRAYEDETPAETLLLEHRKDPFHEQEVRGRVYVKAVL